MNNAPLALATMCLVGCGQSQQSEAAGVDGANGVDPSASQSADAVGSASDASSADGAPAESTPAAGEGVALPSIDGSDDSANVPPEMPLDASECNLAKLDALRCSLPTEQACSELTNEYSTLVRLATDFEQRALMWWNLEPPSECRGRVIVPTTENEGIGEPRLVPCGVEVLLTQAAGHERFLAYAPTGVEGVPQGCLEVRAAPEVGPEELGDTRPIVDECGDMIWIGKIGGNAASLQGGDMRDLWILQLRDGQWLAPRNLGPASSFEVGQTLNRPTRPVNFGKQLQSQRVLLTWNAPDEPLSIMSYTRASGWSVPRAVAPSVGGNSVALWLEGSAGIRRNGPYLADISEDGLGYVVWFDRVSDELTSLHAAVLDETGEVARERVLFEENGAEAFVRWNDYGVASVLRHGDGREQVLWLQADGSGNIAAFVSELAPEGWGDPQLAEVPEGERPFEQGVGEAGRYGITGPSSGPLSLIQFDDAGTPRDLGVLSTPGDIDYPRYSFLGKGQSFLTWNQYDGEASIMDISHCSEEALQFPEGCIPNYIAQPYGIEVVWVDEEGELTQRTACDRR